MAGAHVVDVTDRDFESAVLKKSFEVPVLIDFWAPWCGPCRVLGPTLEKLAGEYAGGFLLAKVNTDENPALATAFRIQSIPTVHLVKDGQPVDGFMGALPESELREFLRPYVSPAGPPPKEEDAGATLDDARHHLEEGRAEEAGKVARALLEVTPDDAAAHLLAARAAIALGRDGEAREHLDAIGEESEAERREGERLRGTLAFRAECGPGEAHWREHLATAPDDLAARYALACCLATAGRYEDALEQLLDVVKRDRAFRDGAARKAMVGIFGLLGPTSDVASRYRKQLAIYL